MKITYYGTAAGKGWPGLFCDCALCHAAWEKHGKNICPRSQALIDDDRLLAIPPDTYMHSLVYRLDLTRVRYLLITHSHNDHCTAVDIRKTAMNIPKLHFLT